ncbi:zinc finger BED domain-containing protein 4-like [Patiria miniata]|uniref:Uncharacterized protein n=2 Tax=Patiria miniata TaxID=46514 RepID=A0A913YXB1_PATMI|nr:zinc finger BED domain-containing protein 4-like [Patiria miniata]
MGSESYWRIWKPGYKVPCRKTMTQLHLMYEQKKDSLNKELQDAYSVALTTDCWTSMSQEGYMTVTCHFIRDWKHHAFVLDTALVASFHHSDDEDQEEETQGPQRHTAQALSNQLEEVVNQWGLSGKVSAVVHDNASNTKDIGTLSNMEVSDVGCAAHTLQLSVNKGLDCNSRIKTVIGGAKRLVGHFEHSNVATKALESKQRQMDTPKHRLISSCKTRWNSVFEMLQ